jgi:hypothetical protein
LIGGEQSAQRSRRLIRIGSCRRARREANECHGQAQN